ncbi:biotin-dependent carboxyltransferase family protein [Pseudoflavitalea sp. G-6-1-2]|uniref:5-oxoprolinase subunit C family protein n=1 Tax=Pseudoflavitalea sp. G-6-1-2 TaxID=2728841 RepID=UPI00146F1CE6|nr:biotin-dependent carboxyltransferase family protein [Pseudoflavitalea sp. G-6-1-2]NML21536.1 biotin-dependent carboxyltransferase family protein [Pseudoflavitalea sp. G-6-1-2]
MSLTIIKPGLSDTIQDTGRFGQAHLGINAGGAMDPYAAGVANMLAGNNQCEAVLEIHFPGPQILFEQNALISITGGDFTPMLNDEPLPLWRPVVVRKNTVLHFNKLQDGARCYLAIHGGFCVKPWLGSYSTNLKAGAGGHQGRRLEKGDELTFRENTVYFAGLLKEGRELQVLNWRVNIRRVYEDPHEICFTPGNEFKELCPNSQEALLENNFIIHPYSDRMGYRLKGAVLKRKEENEMVSSGVNFGTMQLLPDGQLIILMADHQTTGGYPRIGHVITAHLPKLAQLRPGDNIQFRCVDQQTAEDLLYSQQQELVILQRACHDHLNELVC